MRELVEPFKRHNLIFDQVDTTLFLRNNRLTRIVLGDDFLRGFFDRLRSTAPVIGTPIRIDDVFTSSEPSWRKPGAMFFGKNKPVLSIVGADLCVCPG